MAFKMKGSPMQRNFGIGASPAKKTTDPVEKTVNTVSSNEKSIADANKKRSKTIEKVKGDTVKISKKDVLKQMKTTGTKLPYSSIKNALKTSIKAAGKIAKFVPGVAGLVLGATKTSNADQPKKGKGKPEYEGGKIDFSKSR